MAGAALGMVAQLIGGMMNKQGQQKKSGGITPLFGNVGQVGAQTQSGNGQDRSFIAEIIKMMIANKTGGAVAGGVGGTNTGTQTQNVMGQTRTFPTWSPYR